MDCKWLPEYYEAPNWNDYSSFETRLYEFFKLLYFSNPLEFQRIIVRYRHRPYFNNREDVFYHLTCKTYVEGEDRFPDPNRIIRIAWTKAFVENYICKERCCAEKPLYWTKAYPTGIRHKILFNDFLVILEERDKYFLLVTGFYVEEKYYLIGLQKEAQKNG